MIMNKKILFYTISLFLLFSLSSSFASAKEEKYQFELLTTTDMHGRVVTKNISSGKPEINSMARVATIVKKERKKFGKKLILIDNGDIFQGNMVSQYAITEKPKEENPMITAMKIIGYDAWVMGNHEFNYSPLQRDTQVQYSLKSGMDVLAGNIVLKSDGVNVLGEKTKKGQPFYTPYIIKTIDFGNGKKVKVAIIGLGNANCTKWDSADNYPNLQFNTLDNPQGFLDLEINKYTKEIKAKNLADIIIVSAHSGKTTDTGLKTDGFLLESQAVSAVKKTKGIDLFVYGHDHHQNIEKVKNADGKEIYIVNAGGTSVSKNVFTLAFDEKNTPSVSCISAENLSLANYKDDKELKNKLMKWQNDAEKWASSTIGYFGNGWTKLQYETKGKTNKDLVYTQSAINDLIHKVQIWSSWKLYGTKKVKGAVVSVTSSSMAQNPNGIIIYSPKDNDKISLLTLSLLYMYGNNSLCVVDMVPLQLYNWMNKVANKLMIDENGNPAIKPDESLHGVDTFYGIDYAFDLSQPMGKRVVYAKINGQNLLDMKKPIRVVMNNFRIAGAHSFFDTTGLTEKDCVWTSSKEFSMDKSSVLYFLSEYVKTKGKISPDDTVEHSYNSKWHIYTKSSEYKK